MVEKGRANYELTIWYEKDYNGKKSIGVVSGRSTTFYLDLSSATEHINWYIENNYSVYKVEIKKIVRND